MDKATVTDAANSQESNKEAAAANDFPSLRRLVKKALPSTGAIAAAIAGARFKISERDITVLIVTCRKRREWRKAVEIFDAVPLAGWSDAFDQRRRSLAPNFYTFSAVISVCSKSGAVQTALQLFRRMQAASKTDPSLSPDASIYRLIITAAKTCGEHRLAVDMYQEMVSAGFTVDMFTLTCALGSCLEQGEWRSALEVMDHMWGVAHGQEDQGDMVGMREWYLCILKGCRDSGDVDLAVEVLLTMQMVGEELDSEACECVMLAAEIAEDPATGLHLLHEMLENRLDVSYKTEACLMKLLHRTGHMRHAWNVSRWMERFQRGGMPWMAPYYGEDWNRSYPVCVYGQEHLHHRLIVI